MYIRIHTPQKLHVRRSLSTVSLVISYKIVKLFMNFPTTRWRSHNVYNAVKTLWERNLGPWWRWVRQFLRNLSDTSSFVLPAWQNACLRTVLAQSVELQSVIAALICCCSAVGGRIADIFSVRCCFHGRPWITLLTQALCFEFSSFL